MRTLDKYKQNLKIVLWNGSDYVMSCNSAVAKIDYRTNQLIQLGYRSMTKQKHINYIAKKLNLELVKINN